MRTTSGEKMRGRVAMVGLAIAVAMTAGCTAQTPSSHGGAATHSAPTSAAAAHATPHATPLSPSQQKQAAITSREAAVARAVPKAGLVVASTAIATTDGAVGFTADVVATGNDSYDISTSGFHSARPGAAYQMFYRQYPESVGSCISEGVSFGYASWGGSGNSDQVVPSSVDLTTAGDDPTFLKNVVLTVSPPPTSTDDCAWRVVAVAPIVWHAPDRHPALVAHDTGSAPGATGKATTVDGTATSYVTAPGDTEIGVENRFGLSLRDLEYLNVRSKPSSEKFRLFAGQTLNLDAAAR